MNISLRDHQNELTTGGVPFLSDLPIIGALFGRQTVQASETELFLFLTPRVLRNDADGDSAAARYRRP